MSESVNITVIYMEWMQWFKVREKGKLNWQWVQARTEEEAVKKFMGRKYPGGPWEVEEAK